MSIIKECHTALDFQSYAQQNPNTMQQWQKGRCYNWNRILVVKTDRNDAVIFSATLPFRIYSCALDLFPRFGSGYARLLQVKRATFLIPSSGFNADRKVASVGNKLRIEITPSSLPKNPFEELTKFLDDYSSKNKATLRPKIMEALKNIADQYVTLSPFSPQQEKALMEALDPQIFLDNDSAIWKLFERNNPDFQALLIGSFFEACRIENRSYPALEKFKKAEVEAWRLAGLKANCEGNIWNYSEKEHDFFSSFVDYLGAQKVIPFLNSLSQSSATPLPQKELIISGCFSCLNDKSASELLQLNDRAMICVRSKAVPELLISKHPWKQFIQTLTPSDSQQHKWLVHLAKELLLDSKYSWQNPLQAFTTAQMQQLPIEEFEGAIAVSLSLYAPYNPSQLPFLQKIAQSMSEQEIENLNREVKKRSLAELIPLFTIFKTIPDRIKVEISNKCKTANVKMMADLPKEIRLQFIFSTPETVQRELCYQLLDEMNSDEIREALEGAGALVPLTLHLDKYPKFPYSKVLKAVRNPDLLFHILNKIPETQFQELRWEEFDGILPFWFALYLPPQPKQAALLKKTARKALKEQSNKKIFKKIIAHTPFEKLVPWLNDYFRRSNTHFPPFIKCYVGRKIAAADFAELFDLPRDFLIEFFEFVPFRMACSLINKFSDHEIRRVFRALDLDSFLLDLEVFPLEKVLKALHDIDSIKNILKDLFERKRKDKVYYPIFDILEREPWKLAVLLSAANEFFIPIKQEMKVFKELAAKKDEKGNLIYSHCYRLLTDFCLETNDIKFKDNFEQAFKAEKWHEALDLLSKNSVMAKFYLAPITGQSPQQLGHAKLEMFFAAIFDPIASRCLLTATNYRTQLSKQERNLIEKLLSSSLLTSQEQAALTWFIAGLYTKASTPFFEKLRKLKNTDRTLQIGEESIKVHSIMLSRDKFFASFAKSPIPESQRKDVERRLKWCYGLFTLSDLADPEVQKLIHEKEEPYASLKNLWQNSLGSDFTITCSDGGSVTIHKFVIEMAKKSKRSNKGRSHIVDLVASHLTESTASLSKMTYHRACQQLEELYSQKLWKFYR